MREDKNGQRKTNEEDLKNPYDESLNEGMQRAELGDKLDRWALQDAVTDGQ